MAKPKKIKKMEMRRRVLVGTTGSVAAVKLGALVRALETFAEVRVATTEAAEHFWSRGVPALPEGTAVFRDADEWRWSGLGDEVLHIELRRWADVFVVAPLDANSLAKLSGGLCDNLVTCVARCWEVGRGNMLVAPAMNTLMWSHPATGPQMAKLREWGVRVVEPVSKRLACGDVGVGAMAEVETIVEAVRRTIQEMEEREKKTCDV